LWQAVVSGNEVTENDLCSNNGEIRSHPALSRKSNSCTRKKAQRCDRVAEAFIHLTQQDFHLSPFGESMIKQQLDGYSTFNKIGVSKPE
jgi:hypothetical protein